MFLHFVGRQYNVKFATWCSPHGWVFITICNTVRSASGCAYEANGSDKKVSGGISAEWKRKRFWVFWGTWSLFLWFIFAWLSVIPVRVRIIRIRHLRMRTLINTGLIGLFVSSCNPGSGLYFVIVRLKTPLWEWFCRIFPCRIEVSQDQRNESSTPSYRILGEPGTSEKLAGEEYILHLLESWIGTVPPLVCWTNKECKCPIDIQMDFCATGTLGNPDP